jgi:hypothetical protein
MAERRKAPAPSSDKAAEQPAATWEEMEAARCLRVSPGASTALFLPGWSSSWWRRRWTRRRLDRLARELRREGWTTARRYGQTPLTLRVFSASAPCLGESITVVRPRGAVVWWYRSSTGALLAPSSQVKTAAVETTALLTPWVAVALTRPEKS